MRMTTDFNLQLNRLFEKIHALPEQVNRATILALNRTAEFLKSRVSKEISTEQRIKLKLIRDRIRIFRAHKMNLASLLNCDFRGVRASDLGKPRQTKPGAVVGNRLFKGAFVATLKKSKEPGVYRRTTKKRFPLKAERIEIFDDALRIVQDLCGDEARAVFEKRFLHELERITGGIA